jgi:hypothetical protein
MKPVNSLLFLFFICLTAIGLHNHAMWLDETSCWLVARDSNSFGEMLQNNANGGHPIIWNLLLFILSRFTQSIIAMQVLHLCISATAAYLFLRYSPFSVLFKTGVLFSYFIFFEYNLISRSYDLSWLLIVVFCTLYMQEKKNYLLLTITLILLANIHLFSLFVSLPLFIITLYSYSKEATNIKRNLILYCLLFIAAVSFSLYIIIPPEQTLIVRQTAGHYTDYGRISKALSYFVRGYYPLPDFTDVHYWNTNYIVNHAKILSIALTPSLILIPLVLFYNKPLVLLLFHIPNLLILLFIFRLQLLTSVHYKGYLFMLLIISLWLSKDESLTRNYFSAKWTERLNKRKTWTYIPFISSILICQVAAGAYAYYKDVTSPLSEGKEVANYIKTNSPDALVMIEPYYQGPAVAGYLGKKVYYPEKNMFGSFVNWDSIPHMSRNALYNSITNRINATTEKNIALVLAYSDDSIKAMQHYIETSNYIIKEKKEFTRGAIRSENYVVYLIEKK